MDLLQPRPVVRSAVEPVDVLIITAAAGEDDAVRAVDEGGLGEWEETTGPPGFGFAVWRRWYQAADGSGRLSVALCRAYEMGGESTGNAAARLVDAYQPRCLAMCGVCAGDPQKTQLGDVIVADRVYRYDVGEIVQTARGAPPVFRADTMSFPFRATWKQAAESFASAFPASAPWLAGRPRPRAMQADWVLKELLDGRNPLASPDRGQCCADWAEVVGQLQSDKLMRLKADRPQLTAGGRERIQQELFNHGGQLPVQDSWRIRVGPLGTGSNLVRDAGIWDRLGQTQRHILGLDMEGSVIGFTAHVQNVPSFIVAKGVMDYAEPGRGQGFRAFAARAAAEVLLGFLRCHLAPLPRRTAAEILRPNTAQRPEAASPATLLNARYQVVPFFEALRQRELEILEAWCREDHAASVRLLVGPGGSGKTRLLIHFSSTLRAAEPAWHAGFLPERVTAEDLDRLLADGWPTLIVVDYAESRPGLLDVLRGLAARSAEGRAPCRVVLLARDVGDWWLALRQQDADVADLLDRYEPTRLEPVPVKAGLRRQAFEQARECFSRFRAADNRSPLAGASGGDAARVPDLSDDRYGRVLYLHMAALAAVEGVEASPDRLLAEVLVHEARFWRQQYPQRHGEHLADADEFIAGLRRMVAAATLLGGLPSRDAVESLRDRVRGPGLASVPRFLHWLYPGHAETARQAAWVSGLEPDLLGEALIAGVLADRDTPQDYLERVFADGGQAGLRNGFVVLGRIALWDEPQGTVWLARLLEADVPGRARAAFDAALSLGAHTALAPLGRVLAEALIGDGTPELAAELEPLVPWETVSLREVGLWATRILVDRPPPSAGDEAATRERARLLNNAGKRLTDLGRREEALQATAEAVEMRHRLAAQRPDAYLPDLAQSLTNLGAMLSNLGHREDALQPTAEAVEILRRLGEQRPDAFLRDLALSLNNLGVLLSNLARREESLQATAEAVELLRCLTAQRPDAFLPDLAISLNNLGTGLSYAGRRDEALQVTAEAVEIRRRLVARHPDAFLPDLATSLNNLGTGLSDAGRREEALQVTAEAVEIRRRLAAQRPDAFLPDLAQSLNNLAALHSILGRCEEALRPAVEAVEIRRRLAAQRPDAFLPDLAQSLNNLSNGLRDLGHLEEALRATAEAVEISRRLAARRPDAFLPDLAGSLISQGISLSNLGRREEARQATAEAVEISRRLVARHPDAFLPDLATSLNNLGPMLSKLGCPEEALQAGEEAVKIRRRLAAQRPDPFLPHLASSLNNLGVLLSNLGRREDALQATAEAVEISRRLVAQHPDAFLSDLAGCLYNLGSDLSATGRREEALQASAEAVEIRRGLAAQHPDAYLPDLALSLNSLGLDLRDAGRRDEALQTTAEAVRLTLPLAERYPRVFLYNLRGGLQNLRQMCADLGQDPGADPLVREATELLARLDAASGK